MLTKTTFTCPQHPVQLIVGSRIHRNGPAGPIARLICPVKGCKALSGNLCNACDSSNTAIVGMEYRFDPTRTFMGRPLPGHYLRCPVCGEENDLFDWDASHRGLSN